MTKEIDPNRTPGVCVPWEEQKQERPPLAECEDVAKEIWEQTDGLAYMYIWQVLLSF